MRVPKSLKRPHGLVVMLVTAFLIAWAVWSLILLPRMASPFEPGRPFFPHSPAPVRR